MTDPFVCPRCGFVSWNPNDKRERYCGHCHVFVDEESELSPAIKRIIEEVRQGQASPGNSYNRIYNRHNR